MRTSVVPSLLRIAAQNRRQGRDAVRLYELATAFSPRAVPERDPPAVERPVVAAVLAGRRSPVSWAAGGEPADFHDLKGAVEGVLAALGVEAGLRAGGPGGGLAPPARRGAWCACRDGGRLGALGEIHPRVAQAFDLPRGVLAFELDAAALLAAARLVPGYRPIPRLPGRAARPRGGGRRAGGRRGGDRGGAGGAAGRGGHALRRLPGAPLAGGPEEPGAGHPLPGPRPDAHRRRGRRRPRADRRAAGARRRRRAAGLRWMAAGPPGAGGAGLRGGGARSPAGAPWPRPSAWLTGLGAAVLALRARRRAEGAAAWPSPWRWGWLASASVGLGAGADRRPGSARPRGAPADPGARRSGRPPGASTRRPSRAGRRARRAEAAGGPGAGPASPELTAHGKSATEFSS